MGGVALGLEEETAGSEVACSELLDIVEVVDRTTSAQQELYRPRFHGDRPPTALPPRVLCLRSWWRAGIIKSEVGRQKVTQMTGSAGDGKVYRSQTSALDGLNAQIVAQRGIVRGTGTCEMYEGQAEENVNQKMRG